MSQVENIAPATAHIFKQPGCFGSDHFRRGVAQKSRRKVALKSDVNGQQPPRLSQRKLPVYAQHACAGRQQVIPIPVRAGRKNNDWDFVV